MMFESSKIDEGKSCNELLKIVARYRRQLDKAS